MVAKFVFCFLCFFLMFCVGCGENEQARLQVGGDKPLMTQSAQSAENATLSFFGAYPENWEHMRSEQAILVKYQNR